VNVKLANVVAERSRQRRDAFYRRAGAVLCILFGVVAIILPSKFFAAVGVFLIILGLLLLPDYWWFRKYLRNENPYTDGTEE